MTQVQINVVRKDGRKLPLDIARLRATIESASQNLAGIDIDAILSETLKNIYDGVSEDEVNKSAILAARSMIEQDPAYDYVTARLLLNNIRLEILGEAVSQEEMAKQYALYFPTFIKNGIDAELLDEKLAEYDLKNWAPRWTPTAT